MVNQTKIGIPPIRWKIKTLNEISSIPISNGLYKPQDCYGHGSKMIHMTEIFANDFISDQEMPRVNLSEKEKNKYLLKSGDLVFARRSLKPEGAGDVALVEPEENMSFESSIIRVRLGSEILPIFAYYYLKSQYGKAQMMTIVRQVAVSGITGEDLKKYQIPIPPIPEQQKIAQILSTWDKAIEKLAALITAEQKRKNALMQRLLTGKKRFAEFGEEWKEIRLKKIIKEEKTRNKDSSVIRVLSVTNHSGFVLPEDQFSRQVASSDLSNYKIVRKGQFGYNPSRINVGSFARLDNYDVGVLSPMYIVFSIDEKSLDTNFFLNWMNSHKAKQKILSSTQGTVRDSVSFDALESFSISLPSLVEQQKIASVLSSADKEIESHQKQLVTLMQQKEGLMQQLLTGRKQVNIAEVA
ncbi:MAG: restriction endonuclease subunit S [Mucilaginibacter sp.]